MFPASKYGHSNSFAKNSYVCSFFLRPPLLRKSQRGKIVVINSMMGLIGGPFLMVARLGSISIDYSTGMTPWGRSGSTSAVADTTMSTLWWASAYYYVGDLIPEIRDKFMMFNMIARWCRWDIQNRLKKNTKKERNYRKMEIVERAIQWTQVEISMLAWLSALKIHGIK